MNGIDINRAASVSRSIVIRPVQTFNLQLSTQPGTVPVGGQFTYTLSASNVTAGTLNGLTLSVPLPAGATLSTLIRRAVLAIISLPGILLRLYAVLFDKFMSPSKPAQQLIHH